MLGFFLDGRGFSRAMGLSTTGLLVWLAMGVGAGEASARTEQSNSAKRGAAVGARDKAAAKPAPGPLIAVVSLARQRISIYGSEGLLAQSAISSGQAGHRTPTGVFSVIQKNRYHRSNIYSGAPMPYMQRITWSGIALHAGVIPGYPASHGCIRLPHHFAAELWGMTRMGARVVVTQDETSAVELTSPRLPLPTLTPAPEGTPDQAKPELVSMALGGPRTEGTDVAPVLAPRLLNPQERAREAKTRTAAEAISTAKAAKAAVALSAAKAAQANKAIAGLRSAELALAKAQGRLDGAIKTLDGVKTPEAAERAKAAVAAAEAALAEAGKASEAARALEAVATSEALAAARAAWDAENASRIAAAEAKAAAGGTEPISVFISRKTSRLYIRQAWAPIHEVPVTIREPEAPIGTHTYLAVEPAADSKSLRWLSVSFPPGQPVSRKDDDDDEDRPRSRRGKAAQPVEPVPARPHETAAGALDRVDIPEATRAFISERLWTGGSIIISDQGISNETGTYTDFIVLAR